MTRRSEGSQGRTGPARPLAELGQLYSFCLGYNSPRHNRTQLGLHPFGLTGLVSCEESEGHRMLDLHSGLQQEECAWAGS